MVTLGALWLPILLSAVAVFFVSAIVWMALPHHKTDFKRLPDEDGLLEVLRRQSASADAYSFPYATGPKDLQDPEVKARFDRGPVGIVYLTKWTSSMARQLAQTFAFYLVIAVFVAYVAGETLDPGSSYLSVFRIAGTAAIMAHSFAHVHYAIWFGAPWSNTWKNVADGILYGLITAGIFGTFWP